MAVAPGVDRLAPRFSFLVFPVFIRRYGRGTWRRKIKGLG
jgi:hypothetical protein